MAAVDLKSMKKLDQVVLGAGIVALIVSLFFPIWGFSSPLGNQSINAWHGWAGFGMFLVLIATALAAVRIFASDSLPDLPVGLNLATMVLSILGTVIVILRELTYPHASTIAGSYGVKWGGYLLFLVLFVQAMASVLLFRESEEALPDFKAMSANRAAPAAPPTAPYPPSTATPTTS